MWKIAITVLLAALIFAAGFELYGIYQAYVGVKNNYGELKTKAEALREENEKLEAEVSYLSIPENLLKALRERFNYKFPGEKSIIVVPKQGE
ncbi:MAG TPA: septum formation initiator family protein [Candidatus Colwellbacteria bacterium]|nr:septum formation initiator family protein [Candidatus Colwellbacteria bacterium]HQA96040.1 septum formation initiator family protein [Candidatus Colwellbacteria bacterium]